MSKTGEDYVFIGSHAEQLGCGVMKGPGDKFGSDLFDPEGNDTDKRLLDEDKVRELEQERPDPSPDAVELAETDERINLDDVAGTGKDGRVVKSDVQRVLDELPPPGSGEPTVDNDD